MNIRIVKLNETGKLISSLSDEFVVIKNPDFLFPEFEIVPLANKIFYPENIIAAVMDMDGTTTTTEELCVEALEFMIRKMSGLLSTEQWSGLDQIKDYPNVIGNSTTKHVEYLISTYYDIIKKENTISSFVEAITWTLTTGKSEQRKNEVKDLINSLELKNYFQNFLLNNRPEYDQYEIESFSNQISDLIPSDDRTILAKIGIEIYYQHYHQYLLSLSEQKQISSKKLIEPLPGVSVFLPLIKGLLGEEAGKLAEKLILEFRRKNPEAKIDFDTKDVEHKLKYLGQYFEENPLKVAVVTSSIFYEADIVLTEVFNQIRSEIENWEISSSRKSRLLEKFLSYKTYYDAVVTATDAYEFRLKPHRDLYSIALYKLGIPKEEFSKVIGFEDSQSGTIAIRASGIGCCIAVPFPQTIGHDLQAASYVLKNGLPEFIIKHKCLIK